MILNFAKKNTSDSLIRRVDKIDDNYLLGRKYCILCVGRDYESKGFTYWRRSHEIPGVVCCWEHFTPLHYRANLCPWACTRFCPFIVKRYSFLGRCR
ncbi:TniQ family protein [Pseudomonas viridiflava]|uniref:TniQ family protein n=1 Tax=Pseudomonas viridiflava TaxID=33069 RepID=UPI003C7B3F67